jgi:DNA-binding GntR family transcriptional regulator
MAQNETLAVRVAHRLSRLIITGRLRPGTKLVETGLARRLGVSRAPLREAVKELERIGLVTKQSRRGTRVVELDARDVKEIYEVKAMLEGLGARLAAERVTEPELARLEAIFARMQRLAARKDRAGYLDTSRRFHHAFMNASGNTRLVQMYDAMSRQIWWLGTIILTQSDRHKTSLGEHREILDTLRARDSKRAQAVAEDHVRQGGELFFEQFLWKSGLRDDRLLRRGQPVTIRQPGAKRHGQNR